MIQQINEFGKEVYINLQPDSVFASELTKILKEKGSQENMNFLKDRRKE